MKTKLNSLLLALAGLVAGATHLAAQGTAFTYQGWLDDGGNPANGLYDLQFTIYSTASGGSVVAGPLTNAATAVSNGLFTVTLDFGAGVFTGADRWLDIAVRTNGGGAFTTLTPRQALTPTPYAMLAGNVSGVIPNSSLPASPSFSGTVAAGGFAGSGSGLTALNASELTSGTIPAAALGTIPAAALGNAWKITGNTGTTPGTQFLGTADNQALELKVNNQRALRVQPGDSAPNLVGGFAGNVIPGGASGSVIAGGGANDFTNSIAGASYAAIGGGRNNQILAAAASDSVIGGGANHRIEGAFRATIAGGDGNLIQTNNTWGTIGGGLDNHILANSYAATVAGGRDNLINPGSDSAFIGGGKQNTANGAYATILGGRLNEATNHALAAGHRARASHSGAFVWADSTDADFASTTTNQFNVRASGGVRFVTGGAGITLDGQPLATGTNFARLNASQAFTGTNLFTERLGIGVTSPLRSLHVRDISGGLGGDIQVGSTSADGTSKLVHFGDIHASGRGYVAVGETGADDRMELTAGTFVFTNLSQSGRVGIGRLPTANKLEVEGDASKTTAGSWVANSDARIKEDIQPVTGALDTLAKVRLVSFRYTDDYRAAHPGVADRRYLNVVAQEFREVFPEHVKSSGEKLPDGSEILQVDTYPLTIYTAAAVQELRAENAALKARIEKLEQLLSQPLNRNNR